MNRILVLTAVIGLSLAMEAQPQERGGSRNLPPGEAAVGKVTSVDKDSLVIGPLAGGSPVTVKVSDATHVMKDRQPAKLSDIKTNDVVFVRGQMSGGSLAAAVVGVMNPEMAQRIQQEGMGTFGMGRGEARGAAFGMGRGEARGAAFGGAGAFNRDDLGKKFILGEVKAINETKLTIARPDGQSQDIDVDENTSFKRGNESITLPDIKAGDFVRGTGEVKNGVFVPKELAVGRPQIRMMFGAPDNSQPQQGSSANQPSTQAPPKN